MPSRAPTHGDIQVRGSAMSRGAVLSLLITAAFFAFFLGIMHPGYAINDDIKIIAIAAGYPGVQPSPFLIFSNVLLGFLLVALYKLPTTVNWEIVLFLLVDAVSVCTLLYFITTSSLGKMLKVVGVILVLACASYYPLKITFTSTAGLACTAGLLAILAGASRSREQRAPLLLGTVLVFVASLIRLEMVAIAAPVALVYAALFHRTIRWGIAWMAMAGAALLVLFGFAFNDLYVRAHDDWQAFYVYNKAAQAIQDSHRLENLHTEIRRIGWTKNDQEMFARYFYPDSETYSLEHLRYLVDRVPGTSLNPAFVLQDFARRILAGRALLSLLVCLSAWLLAIGLGRGLAARMAIPLAAAAALSENLVLMWIYKSPDYVLLSTLANAALFSVVLVFLPGISTDGPRVGLSRRAVLAGLITASVAVGLGLWQSQGESSGNHANELAYAQILNDVHDLQENGAMGRDATILSSSHGIPWHWGNPLWIRFPDFTYLDTGWNTFSPYYNEALLVHELQPLTDVIAAGDRVYLTSKPVFQGYLARYLEEHAGRAVQFETVYNLPDGRQEDGERGIILYKIIPASHPVP